MTSTIFARKPVQHLVADLQAAPMTRSLGAWDLVLLGVGVIMGTGIFVLTGHAAAVNAGPAVTISFIVAGLAAGLSGLCYAEMAAMIPVSGSAYTYAYATMGELLAFLIGWDLILEYLVGAATVTVGWSGYVTALVHRLFGIQWSPRWTQAPLGWDEAAGRVVLTGHVVNLPAVIFAVGVTLLLTAGTKQSARINGLVVLFKLVAIGLFLVLAVPQVDPALWRPFVPPNQGSFGAFGPSGIFQGATMVFFAYIGFDAISTVAQETRRPQRDLPIGMIGSLVICVALYVAVSLVLCGLVPFRELSVPHPLAVGAAGLGYGWLEVVVELGALCGLFSGALVMLMGQPRIFAAMARDGLFPAFAARRHPSRQTLVLPTLFSGGLCAIIGGLLPIGILGELTSIGTLFAFVLVSLAVMVMRLTRPQVPRPFRVPGGPFLVPLASSAVSFGLMLTATAATRWRLGLWMALGLGFYFLYSRRHSRLRQAPGLAGSG